MADYLIRFSYTPDTLEGWMQDPIDRTPMIADAVKAMGGELKGFWLAFGEHDGYVLISADEPITPAAMSVLDRVGGFMTSMETTVLLSVDEMRAALSKASEVLASFSE